MNGTALRFRRLSRKIRDGKSNKKMRNMKCEIRKLGEITIAFTGVSNLSIEIDSLGRKNHKI